MTIDEALVEIHKTQRCLVVWNSTTGEILAVSEMNPNLEGRELFSHLRRFPEHKSPVKSRTFVSAKVTREVLEREQIETERVNARVHILARWSTAPGKELLEILESGTYDYPMARDNDSCILVDHLWRLHRDELAPLAQTKLQRLVGVDLLSRQASLNLELYLLALAGDEDRLVERWKFNSGDTLRDLLVLMECIAHVNVRDRSVVNDLIDFVGKESFMFGPRERAMVTLGILDAARGTSAAKVIRATVYDSVPEIIHSRERVLTRLETSPDFWSACHKCSYGWIHGEYRITGSTCPKCLGLGLVQKS